MAVPPSHVTTTCDIYRPFGAGSPTTTGVACRLVPDLATVGGGAVVWTDYLDLDETVDVRDGCTRAAGSNSVTYNDGDEVRIPNASGTRYVVVWVALMNRGTARPFKRVYLMRDTAAWPGP